MNDNRGKILGTFIFVVLISLMFYLIFFLSAKKETGEIEMIEVTGNVLLDGKEYLSFTRLDNIAEDDGISLPLIKDRFEKHPYVRAAEVEYVGNKKIEVLLTEKKILAVILIEPEPYFISEDFQVLPMFLNTKFIDVPVISNAVFKNDPAVLSYARTDELTEAMKIIESVRMTNHNMSSSLSEINLRNGGDIILTFSGLRAPVIFGRKSAAKKMVYLEMLWDKLLNGKGLVERSEYVDLRFANEIFIGSAETTGLSE